MLHVAFLGIGHVFHLHQACQWASVVVAVGLLVYRGQSHYACASKVVTRRILGIGRVLQSCCALAIT